MFLALDHTCASDRRTLITHSRGQTVEFEADGELLAALSNAYIKLLEFAHDRGRRLEDHHLDDRERVALRHVLNGIVRLSDK